MGLATALKRGKNSGQPARSVLGFNVSQNFADVAKLRGHRCYGRAHNCKRTAAQKFCSNPRQRSAGICFLRHARTHNLPRANNALKQNGADRCFAGRGPHATKHGFDALRQTDASRRSCPALRGKVLEILRSAKRHVSAYHKRQWHPCEHTHARFSLLVGRGLSGQQRAFWPKQLVSQRLAACVARNCAKNAPNQCRPGFNHRVRNRKRCGCPRTAHKAAKCPNLRHGLSRGTGPKGAAFDGIALSIDS